MREMTRTSPLSTGGEEQKLARAVSIALPVLTLVATVAVGVVVGLATSLLVLAAGLLLGVIALLWGSLRVLTGDAPLPPELEELEVASRGVDGLSLRKQMLLRALKDLDHERAIGKLEPEDFAQISASYRTELKTVMKKMDASLAPYRERAEALARSHLARRAAEAPADAATADAAEPPTAAEPATAAEPPTADPASAAEPPDAAEPPAAERELPRATRKSCSGCGAANEADAKFCKECAAPFAEGAPLASSVERAASESGDVDPTAAESSHAS